MRQEYYTEQIHVDDLCDLLRCVLCKRLPPCNTGIVYEHIDAPEHGQRLFCQARYLREVRNVGRNGDCPVSRLGDRAYLCLQLVYAPCCQYYLCSTPSKFKGCDCTDA